MGFTYILKLIDDTEEKFKIRINGIFKIQEIIIFGLANI
jgi:hypothetical protein